jgi:hypothetical protein
MVTSGKEIFQIVPVFLLPEPIHKAAPVSNTPQL